MEECLTSLVREWRPVNVKIRASFVAGLSAMHSMTLQSGPNQIPLNMVRRDSTQIVPQSLSTSPSSISPPWPLEAPAASFSRFPIQYRECNTVKIHLKALRHISKSDVSSKHRRHEGRNKRCMKCRSVCLWVRLLYFRDLVTGGSLRVRSSVILFFPPTKSMQTYMMCLTPSNPRQGGLVS